VHRTRHTVPSVGYIVWDRRKKLKPEYVGMSGDEIRDVRLAGAEVSEEKRFPLVAYLGDSQPRGLDENPDMYRAKILIAEMTFVAPQHRREKIHKNGHMHLDDFIARKNRFENDIVIASHFSTRYNDRQIRQYVEKLAPDLLAGKLYLWV
ncbi:MAG: metal-dependent hydrolase, partial [bacterium]|nr:metal-dependent hydrolase [bacterium]